MVRLLRNDRTYADVARVLGCAPATVRVHVNRIASRLPYSELTPKRAVLTYRVHERVFSLD